jgi:DNA polymerase-3 subunit delta
VAHLTPQDAAREWKSGSLRPVYLLTGGDSALKSTAVDYLKKSANAGDLDLSEFSGTEEAQASEIVSACSTLPMLSVRRLVVVRALKLGLRGRKLLADYLGNPAGTTVLVLLSPETAKKETLSAAAARSGAVVEFGPLKPAEAADRLRREASRAGFEISAEAAAFVVEEAGCDWGILRGEIEKIGAFVGPGKTASSADAAACLGYRAEAGPFDLDNALDAGDAAGALRVLERMIDDDSDIFGILPKIKSSFNKRLRAKRLLASGRTPDETAREVRIPFFKAGEFLRKARRQDEADLVAGLEACLQAETALKSKAWIDPVIEIQGLVLRACGKGGRA